MKYSNIVYNDTANGQGMRISFFVQGCPHHCKGCFNQESWDFNGGIEFTQDVLDEIMYVFGSFKEGYDGITFLGGEPLELPNQKGVLELLKRVREECPDRNVWLYTGYTYESDLLNKESRIYSETLPEILKYVDILVDGKWIASLYDENIQYRGSTNQRVIDLRKTEVSGSVVIWDKLER